MNNPNLLIFAAVVIVVWCLVIYFWPRLMLSAYKRALLTKGFGDGPIPINTLYTQPQELFANPLTAPSASDATASDATAPGVTASNSSPLTVGVNHDTLLAAGWLDLRQRAAGLARTRHEGPGRVRPLLQCAVYRSFEKHGFCLRRQTHHRYAGGRLPHYRAGLERAGSGWPEADRLAKQRRDRRRPHARRKRSDLPTAYALSKQIQLTPLSAWRPGQ